MLNIFFKKKKVKKDTSFDYDLTTEKAFVHREAAFQHQHDALKFRRATEADRITLGEILVKLFDTDKESVISMAVMCRSTEPDAQKEQSVINSPDSVWNFDVFSCILKNKTPEGHYVDESNFETSLVVNTKSKTYVFALTALPCGIKTVKYMRVSFLSPDNSATDDGRTMKTSNEPSVCSFILSYAETDSDCVFDRYAEVASMLKYKIDNHIERNEVDRAFINGQLEYAIDHFESGIAQFDVGRFYDAYTILEREYNYLVSQINVGNDEIRDQYYHVCNVLGSCLSHMNREVEASFYYRQGADGLSPSDLDKLAFCYAALGNPMALDRMTDNLSVLEKLCAEQPKYLSDIDQATVVIPSLLTQYKKNFDQQNTSFRDGITIGYALKELWGLDTKNIVPCMFVFDIKKNEFIDRIEDSAAIFDHPLSPDNAADKVFVLSCSHDSWITQDQKDRSTLCHNTPIVIATHTVNGADNTPRIRIDMMRHNFANDDDKRELVAINTPLNTTFTICNPEGVTYQPIKENIVAAIDKATDWMHENRYMEAVKLSKWAFELASNNLKDKSGLKYDSDDEQMWENFYEAAYVTGYCLMELLKMTTAEYYLYIAAQKLNVTYVHEYINCLANSKNPAALSIVDETIKNSPKPQSEEYIDAWNQHISFLKRRKAYILIDMQRYSEARQMLVEMLDNPYSNRFAANELRYLDQLEKDQ